MIKFLSLLLMLFMLGCQTPYSGHLGPEDFNGWIESEENGFVCLWNGFDRICIQSIPGKDGKDGTDGVTLIAIHEMPVEIIIEKIIETVVVEKVIKEVPVKIVIEKVVTEFVDREIPIEVFIERTVEIIKEVFIEVEVIKEVPVETIIEVIKTVYVGVPTQRQSISVTEGAIYTESGYNNPSDGSHAHEYTHTHNGANHTHRIVHPDGEKDDWDREHDGFSGLAHE